MQAENNFKYEVVMLIDDNEIDVFINENIIKGCGFAENVFKNTSTKSAIEFLKNISMNRLFDSRYIPTYIFLDINMPMLDGFQFIEEFEKLDDKISSSCKIVMLSSSVSPEDEKRARASKCVVEYVYKPLTEKILKKL